MAITRVLYSALGCAASALLISGGNLLELRRLLQGPQKVPRTIELLVRDTFSDTVNQGREQILAALRRAVPEYHPDGDGVTVRLHPETAAARAA
jgi:hypothetical protein